MGVSKHTDTVSEKAASDESTMKKKSSTTRIGGNAAEVD